MSSVDINPYEGAGYVPGLPAGSRKKTAAQSIKEAHRNVMKAFALIGTKALNAADFERTMHLPVGRGRLACDETGEFDGDAPRKDYRASDYPQYPRHVHSTITDGEFLEVKDSEAHYAALVTKRWADKPLEKKRRFTLTPEDQMQNLKAQIESERAARLFQEKEFEARMAIVPEAIPASAASDADILRLELAQEREHRKILEARVEAILASLSLPAAVEVAVETEDENEEESEEEVEQPAIMKRGRR